MRTYGLFLLISFSRQSFCFLLPLYDAGNSTNKFFDIGNTVTLSCQVTEKEEKASEIQWGRFLEETNETRYIKDEIKTTGIDMSTLSIHSARHNDSGEYFCEYDNQTYSFNVIAKLHVKIRPHKEVLCAIEGEMLLLKCVGIGTKVHLKWFFNGHINDIKFIRKFGPNFQSNTLVIKKTEKSHAGDFRCEARHDHTLDVEEAVSKSIKVRVRDHYVGMFNVVFWPKTCAVFFLSDKELHNF